MPRKIPAATSQFSQALIAERPLLPGPQQAVRAAGGGDESYLMTSGGRRRQSKLLSILVLVPGGT